MMTALTNLIWIIIGVVVVSFMFWVAGLAITLIEMRKITKEMDSGIKQVGIFTPRVSKKFRK